MKKDVIEYFMHMQKQMNDMDKMFAQFNKEISEGLVSEEQKNNFLCYYESVRNNYQRVAYIMYLLNQPPQFVQNYRMKKQQKLQKKAERKFKEQHATMDDVIEENEQTLANTAELMKEIPDAAE